MNDKNNDISFEITKTPQRSRMQRKYDVQDLVNAIKQFRTNKKVLEERIEVEDSKIKSYQDMISEIQRENAEEDKENIKNANP